MSDGLWMGKLGDTGHLVQLRLPYPSSVKKGCKNRNRRSSSETNSTPTAIRKSARASGVHPKAARKPPALDDDGMAALSSSLVEI